jgi:propionyl-CoA synthetase
MLGVPVIDHWWQTETGWAIAANCMGIEQLPVKPGSPTKPVPGYDVQVLDDDGHEQVKPGRSAAS